MHHGQEIFMNIPIPRRGLECNTKTILVHMVMSFLHNIVPHFFRVAFEGCS